MTEKSLPHRTTGGLGGSSEEEAVPDLDLTNVCMFIIYSIFLFAALSCFPWIP